MYVNLGGFFRGAKHGWRVFVPGLGAAFVVDRARREEETLETRETRKPAPKTGWKRVRRRPHFAGLDGDQEVSRWTTLHRAYDAALRDAEPQPALKKSVAAPQSKRSEAGLARNNFRACGSRKPGPSGRAFGFIICFGISSRRADFSYESQGAAF